MAKSLTDFPTYEMLPFLLDTALVRRKGASIKSHRELVDPSTGEVIDGAITYGDSEFDPTNFMKVYFRGFNNISKLNPYGLKVLLYLMKHSGKNVVNITIDTTECLEFCGYSSRNPMYKGLIDLLDNKIIAKATGKMNYWINPNVFYNGTPNKIVKDQIANPPNRIESWKI